MAASRDEVATPEHPGAALAAVRSGWLASLISTTSGGGPGKPMEIKRILTFVDEVRSEAGRRADPPLRKSAAVAIVQNPFAGKYVEDLSPLTVASEAIGREICAIAVALLAPDKPASYGKAAVVGLAGEQEHGNAMLTTVYGNVMREAAGGGKAWISSFTKRAAPGSRSTSRLRTKTHYMSDPITTGSALR